MTTDTAPGQVMVARYRCSRCTDIFSVDAPASGDPPMIAKCPDCDSDGSFEGLGPKPPERKSDGLWGIVVWFIDALFGK